MLEIGENFGSESQMRARLRGSNAQDAILYFIYIRHI
jgi:hypothetical protein